MRSKALLAILVFVISIGNIKAQAPTADRTSGCVNLRVNFSTTTGGPWDWDFGDLSGSSLQNPEHNYTTAGNYTVILKQGAGGSTIGTIDVVVSNKPTLALTTIGPTTGCYPLAVDFDVNVTGLAGGVTASSYIWTFGDFKYATSIDSDTNNTYTGAGVFDVTVGLKTSDSTCNTSFTFDDFITTTDAPSTDFSFSQSSSCIPVNNIALTNSFPNDPYSSYKWYKNGTLISSNYTPPLQNFPTDGNFTYSLSVTNSANCTNAKTRIFSVGAPVAKYSTVIDTFCVNQYNTFSATVGGSYLWKFDASATKKYGATKANQSVKFSTGGIHTFTLSVTADGCTDDTIGTIYVDNPIVTFTTRPSYTCSEPADFVFNASTASSNVASWNWIFSNGAVETTPNFTHTYRFGDSTYTERGYEIYDTTYLSITTTNGCVSPTYLFQDSIFLPWARFMPDKVNGCTPLNVTFSDSSRSKETITSWEWNFGDPGSGASNTSSLTNPSHTFVTAGTYSVSLIITNNAGCKDTSYFVMIEAGDTISTLDFDISNTTPCHDELVNLTNNTSPADIIGVDAWNYSSSGELLSGCFTSDEILNLSFDDSVGLQTITFTAERNGCYSSTSKTITVLGPIAHFTAVQDCDTPYEVTFTDESDLATNLTWDFGDGSPTVNTTGTFTHTYTAKSLLLVPYTVTLTATSGSGCNPSIETADIHIKEIEAILTFSNIACDQQQTALDGSASVDVYNSGFNGYSFFFSDTTKRPYTYSDSIINTRFATNGLQEVGLVVKDINGCVDTVRDSIKVFDINPLFTVNDDTICFPAILTFSNIAQPISGADTAIQSWVFNYGDGSALDTILGPNFPVIAPTHTYTAPPGIAGTNYTVSMVITNTVGCKDTFSLKLTTYKPTTVVKSPSKAAEKGCVGSDFTFNANDYTFDNSSLTFDWNYGDGTTEPSIPGSPTTHSYSASATYTYTLVYTEVGSGCVDSITNRTINIQDYPTPFFWVADDIDDTINNGSEICSGEQIIFHDTSKIGGIAAQNTTTTQWDFGAGTYTTPLDFDPAPDPFEKGTYEVNMKVITTNGCQSILTKTLTIVGPQGSFTIDTNLICKGESVWFEFGGSPYDTIDVAKWIWDFGDGEIDTTNKSKIPHTYNYLPQNGQTKASLTLISGAGCTSYPSPDTTINIKYIKSNFITTNFSDSSALDTLFCISDDIIIIDSIPLEPAPYINNANVYDWDFGDGESSTQSGNQTHTYSSPGTYTVSLSVSNDIAGCPDTSSQEIIIYKLPLVNTRDSVVCLGDSLFLKIDEEKSPNYTYSWAPDSALNYDTVYQPFIQEADWTRDYILTVTDNTQGNACTNTDTFSLEVLQHQVNIPPFDSTIVVGDTITLPAEFQNSYVDFTWTPSTGLSCTDCPNPVIQPLGDEATYILTMKDFITDKVYCTAAEAEFNITIKPEMYIALPTTFTPNGDGNNDIIYVKGWGIKTMETFEIYNRWGERVFETDDINVGWDGYYKGTLQNNDTYIYKVLAKSWRETEINAEGHINLMR